MTALLVWALYALVTRAFGLFGCDRCSPGNRG